MRKKLRINTSPVPDVRQVWVGIDRVGRDHVLGVLGMVQQLPPGGAPGTIVRDPAHSVFPSGSYLRHPPPQPQVAFEALGFPSFCSGSQLQNQQRGWSLCRLLAASLGTASPLSRMSFHFAHRPPGPGSQLSRLRRGPTLSYITISTMIGFSSLSVLNSWSLSFLF